MLYLNNPHCSTHITIEAASQFYPIPGEKVNVLKRQYAAATFQKAEPPDMKAPAFDTWRASPSESYADVLVASAR